MIILNGVNYWPHDIDQIVEQSHSGFRRGCSAAFSVDHNNERGEELVVLVEAKRSVVVNDIVEKQMKHSIQKVNDQDE